MKRAMTENEWSELMTESVDLSKPILKHNFFSEPLVTEKEVLEAIRNFVSFQDDNKKVNLRVYTPGREEKVEEQIANDAPTLHENCKQWTERIFRGREFGIVLNRVERWSNPIAAKVTSLLGTRLISHFGSSKLNIEIVLFIGNYGYSPFGAHVDKGTSIIFHLHLGPHAKEMILWTKDEYLTSNGSLRRNFNPESIRASGTVFTYQPNDLFLLPPYYYHVGNSQQFSIMLAVVTTFDEDEVYLERVSRTGLEEYLSIGSESFSSQNRWNLPYAEWLRETARCYALRRESNLYLLSPPVPSPSNEVGANSEIKINNPFKIKFNLSDILDIYVRGHHMLLRPHSQLDYLKPVAEMINKINEGGTHRAEELVQIFPIGFDPEAVYFILSEFARYSAICIKSADRER